MTRRTKAVIHGVVLVALIGSIAGCASASKGKTAGGMTEVTSAATAATAAAATVPGADLFKSLGGATGVRMLAEAFGAKLGLDPNVTQFLDEAAIADAEGGLQNTIATVAGQSPPAGTTDLLGALSGKGLNAAAIDGVTQALMGAGKDQKLNEGQLAGLQAIMQPITSTLSKGQ